jgi:hypothetical protein
VKHHRSLCSSSSSSSCTAGIQCAQSTRSGSITLLTASCQNWAKISQRDGQCIASQCCYLRACRDGSETIFPLSSDKTQVVPTTRPATRGTCASPRAGMRSCSGRCRQASLMGTRFMVAA